MALRYYRNGPAVQLAAPCTSSDTSISVSTVTGLPTQYPYTLILDPDTASEEVVDVTAGVSTTLTVTRAADSTVAAAHAAGVSVYHGVSARDAREANTHVNTTTGAHGVSGSLVDTDSVQSISGAKTFSTLATTAGGSVITVAGAQTITGAKTFNATTTFAGATTHTGTATFGTTVHNGLASFTSDVTIDGHGITGAWESYVPEWTSGGSTTLNIGNGSLTGAWRRIAKTVFFRIALTRGSTTNLGTTFYTFSLPIAAQSFLVCGAAMVVDASSGVSEYAYSWRAVNGTQIVVVDRNGSRISGSSPITWATSDQIFLSGSYEAA